MSKKRGVSLDDKRKRMLEIFYERKDVFQLKELEKIGPKEKGIVAQSVKDVLQGLVDDNYVDTEKIGTSCYFWAFPSKATQVRKGKIAELDEKLKETVEKGKELEQTIKKAKLSRNDSDDREQVLERLRNLKKEKEMLMNKLVAFKDSDPEVVEKEKNMIEVGLQATNQWTDNIFAIRSWAKNVYNMDEETFNKNFEIPETLDYIELPSSTK